MTSPLENLERCYRFCLQLCSGHPRTLETTFDALVTKSELETSVVMPTTRRISELKMLEEFWDVFCEMCTGIRRSIVYTHSIS